MKRLLVIACAILAALTAVAAAPKSPVRLLVVTGGHDYETSFYTLFEGYPDLVWDHATSNKEAFKQNLVPKYDVLLLYDMSQELDEKGRQNFQVFADSGKGVIVLHHALVSYQTWGWWSKELVGARYRLEKEADNPASTYKHDEELRVSPTLEHPITAGLKPFQITDETYKGMWISPEVKVLLRTDNPTSDGPVAWITPYQKSRVVSVQLGHDSKAHRHPVFREIIRRAVFWSAGRLE